MRWERHQPRRGAQRAPSLRSVILERRFDLYASGIPLLGWNCFACGNADEAATRGSRESTWPARRYAEESQRCCAVTMGVLHLASDGSVGLLERREDRLFPTR